MQFKYPEVLYGFVLLLIPIFIHLFQLRRFEKVPFTNVAFLKKVELQTRKSSKLKHFLILLSRLLFLAALIFAFAQPINSKNKKGLQPKTILYIDNSLSMQAKNSHGELLQDAVQNSISNFKTPSNLTVLTNDAVYQNNDVKSLKNDLLSIKYTPFSKDIQTVLLEANTLFKKEKGLENNLILISDFQSNNLKDSLLLSDHITYSFVQLLPKDPQNISIDSLYIAKQNGLNIELDVVLKSHNIDIEAVSVALFKEHILSGKTTCSLKKNQTNKVRFSIPFEENFKGRITIEDHLLLFDNDLFFTLNKPTKINVLAIGDTSKFLSKIYTNSEFNLTTNTLNRVNYNTISSQNLIVLNELKTIPISLQKNIIDFVSNGGSLVIIPSIDMDISNYNQLFTQLHIGRVLELTKQDHQVNSINFSHHILSDVFEKHVSNFQYPNVNSFYSANLINNKPILRLDNQNAFITEVGQNRGQVYWVSSALNTKNSDFINSPLIVPVFYNFGKQSFKVTDLYYTIGQKNTIAVKTNLHKDAVLHIKNNLDQSTFIPLQKASPQKVRIETEYQPTNPGFYTILKNEDNLKNIAFNYNRLEGNTNYTNIEKGIKPYKNANFSTDVKQALEKIQNDYKITSYWKWFLILALLCLFIESLLVKFL